MFQEEQQPGQLNGISGASKAVVYFVNFAIAHTQKSTNLTLHPPLNRNNLRMRKETWSKGEPYSTAPCYFSTPVLVTFWS